MKSLFKLASRRAVLPPTFAGQTHSLDEREVNGLFRWALNLLAAPSLKKNTLRFRTHNLCNLCALKH